VNCFTLHSACSAPSTGTILDVTVLGSRLFFITETTAGQELWVSDGTPKGTRALTAVTPIQPCTSLTRTNMGTLP
jgi:ELWxxDGT repeat protein